MKNLSPEDYELLTAQAEVLAADGYGVKVLRTPDGRIIKLFRLKRVWSSARLWPYASRFSRNTRILREKGFATVEVLETARSASLRRNIVIYRELDGQGLRDALRDEAFSPAEKEKLIADLAQLLARLHDLGILFRSIHFGDVLVRPDKSLALIDVADLHKNWFFSLSASRRLRNFRHM